ncbi:MAG: NYN domain-containing protein [bacterium]
MRYLIDGYNLLHSTRLAISQSPQPIYELIELLITITQSDPKKKFTLVFDGYSPKYYDYKTMPTHGNIKIIFSMDESADDNIIHRCELAKNKNELTVITNDRSLQMHAKSHNVPIWTIREFEHFIEKKWGDLHDNEGF